MTVVISVVILVCLICASFAWGMHVAEYYATLRERTVEYALRKQYARLMAGVDADDTAQPYVSPETNLQNVNKF